MLDSLKIADREFKSRLFTGTGKYASGAELAKALEVSESELVTVAFKRVERENREDPVLDFLNANKQYLLPNTSGVRSAKEAVLVAELAREALETNWIKLEIHPDVKYLMPDAIETLKAAEELVKKGFIVLPYVHADPVLCKRLEEVGTAAVMPLGSPIGSNQGLESRRFLEIIIEQAQVPVIVDAGIGRPSQAAEAMELGADAVLVNTAIASAKDPIQMAEAFRKAVEAGRSAHLAQLGAVVRSAVASSPIEGFLSNLV